MLRTPDGHGIIELSEFHSPKDENEIQTPLANTLGIRHICFAVDELDGLVSKLKKHGAELIGEIVNYENSYKLCYIRGPEGIILELAEQLGK
jgi:catechol 2,3-dioxygenase-like lactoylglutathione lyase family enzyme